YDSVYAVGDGWTAVLTSMPLPYGREYLIKVFRKEGSGAGLQRYRLTLIKSVSTEVALGDVPAPAGLHARVAPNPFNPTTSAKFYAPEAGAYSVSVFDVSGRLARRIEGRSSIAGWVEVPWDGRDDAGAPVSSGVYLIRVNAGGRSETVRSVLVR
ncbi:MAG: T9SS C-terminal target domain-containing protein, partial [Candidatus Latescibacterota bacterium]